MCQKFYEGAAKFEQKHGFQDAISNYDAYSNQASLLNGSLRKSDDRCCQIFDLTTRKSCQTKYLTIRVFASTWWTQNRNEK